MVDNPTTVRELNSDLEFALILQRQVLEVFDKAQVRPSLAAVVLRATLEQINSVPPHCFI